MMKIKMFTVNPVQENTYVIYDETGEGAIIDCGCMSPEEERAVQSFIERESIRIYTLTMYGVMLGLCAHGQK